MALADQKRESVIEKKMAAEKDLLADIDFDAVYDDENIPQSVKKPVFTVWGEKNDGKTTITYGLMEDGDTALVFSFDHKSARPIDPTEGLKFLTDANITIKVVDATKYYNHIDNDLTLATAELTFKYITRLLTDYADPKNEKAKINGKSPDWVVIDGTERMKGIMEMYMRKQGGLPRIGGVPQQTWKYRAEALDSIHDLGLAASNKGLVYTAFADMKEIIDNNAVTKRKEIPKWQNRMRDETDVEIRAEANRDGKKCKYYAIISGSKLQNSYPDGTYDVTDKRLSEVLNETD